MHWAAQKAMHWQVWIVCHDWITPWSDILSCDINIVIILYWQSNQIVLRVDDEQVVPPEHKMGFCSWYLSKLAPKILLVRRKGGPNKKSTFEGSCIRIKCIQIAFFFFHKYSSFYEMEFKSGALKISELTLFLSSEQWYFPKDLSCHFI